MNKLFDSLSPEKQAWVLDNPVMYSYVKRGFLKTPTDVDDLHRCHSPFRIPKGLTRYAVRRRINKFVKSGRNIDTVASAKIMFPNRLEIRVNGKMMVGASFTSKVPENSRQLNKLLKGVMEMKKGRKKPLPKGF
jgi:hypothetical protein